MTDIDDSIDYLPALVRGLSEAIEYGRQVAYSELELTSAVERETLTIIEDSNGEWRRTA
jgi:hypothetical protein